MVFRTIGAMRSEHVHRQAKWHFLITNGANHRFRRSHFRLGLDQKFLNGNQIRAAIVSCNESVALWEIDPFKVLIYISIFAAQVQRVRCTTSETPE